MGNTIPARSKRMQRDYKSAFKLSLVNGVEKANSATAEQKIKRLE